jgi:predicted  nucleic acid-binding Zn-ribbon protein
LPLLNIFECLTHLQNLDGIILNQKKKITQKNEEIRKTQQNIENKKIEWEDYRKVYDKERIELSRLELELKDVEEKLNKSQNRLYSGDVQSGKELSQWKSTMENYEKTKSNLEDYVINQIDKIEEMRIKEKEKEHQLSIQRFEKDIESLKKDIEKIKSDLANNIQLRTEAIQNIPEEVLFLYEELRKKFSDPVVEMDGDTCRGCHLGLPSSVAKRVRKKEEIIQCPNCQRLIFYK